MRKEFAFKVVGVGFAFWFALVGLTAAYRYCYLFVYGFELLPIPHTGALHMLVSFTSFGFIYFFITQAVIIAAAYLSIKQSRTAYLVFSLVLFMRICEISFAHSFYTEVYRGSTYLTSNAIAVLSWSILVIYCYFNFTKTTLNSTTK